MYDEVELEALFDGAEDGGDADDGGDGGDGDCDGGDDGSDGDNDDGGVELSSVRALATDLSVL